MCLSEIVFRGNQSRSTRKSLWTTVPASWSSSSRTPSSCSSSNRCRQSSTQAMLSLVSGSLLSRIFSLVFSSPSVSLVLSCLGSPAFAWLWPEGFCYLQFIDGRLDLLNAGEGFSDLFEEEINLSEDAGELLLFSFPAVVDAFWYSNNCSDLHSSGDFQDEPRRHQKNNKFLVLALVLEMNFKVFVITLHNNRRELNCSGVAPSSLQFPSSTFSTHEVAQQLPTPGLEGPTSCPSHDQVAWCIQSATKSVE